MRIAHLGDLHVTEGPRLADQQETLGSIVDDVLAANPDLVLLAGDFYGHTVPHRSTPAERAVLFPAIVRLARRCPVVVIYGNHDHDPDLDALASLDGEWPVYVVKRAEVLTVPTARGELAHVYALPYPTKARLLAGEDAPRGLAEAQAAVQEKLGLILNLWGARIRRRRVSHPADVHLLLAHVQVSGSATSGGEVLAGQEIELTRNQLDGVPVDYGALGHLHMRQEPAPRCWYPGSPWRNDHSERDAKGWHLVETNAHPNAVRDGSHGAATWYTAVPGERLPVTVRHVASACRDFVTLDYRWAADHEDGAPRWIRRPSEVELATCKRAEVRARLVVPEQWIAGCPWADELARITAAGAVRISEERKIEPVVRVRAPSVAAAVSEADKLDAYWSTLGAPPDALEQAAAREILARLTSADDEEIASETAALLAAPVGTPIDRVRAAPPAQ